MAQNRCDGDISSHLQKHRLSRENVCEKDLILARAGLLEHREEHVKNNTRAKCLHMHKVSIFKLAVANANFTTRMPVFELKIELY